MPTFCRQKLRISAVSALLCVLLLPANTMAADSWNYIQETDRLTNRSFSIARSPFPRRDLYDNLRLEVLCKDNVLQATIESNSLIASQGSRFDVEYQIDQKPPVKIQMTTYKDSKRRGYTSQHAQTLVADMLTGQAIFIRVNTLIRKVLSGSIPLEGAVKPLTQVLTDCGISASGKPAESAYNLSDFQLDFAKLNAEQQRQLMDNIKKIIMEMH